MEDSEKIISGIKSGNPFYFMFNTYNEYELASSWVILKEQRNRAQISRREDNGDIEITFIDGNTHCLSTVMPVIPWFRMSEKDTKVFTRLDSECNPDPYKAFSSSLRITLKSEDVRELYSFELWSDHHDYKAEIIFMNKRGERIGVRLMDCMEHKV